MREEETMGSKQRIHNIDIIKGVCVLFVITEHTLSPALKANILFPFWGKQAVPVFMLLSGYLYAMSFEKGRPASFLTLWSAKRIVNQILRYSVPFFCFYFVESAASLVANGVSKIPDILTLWIRGGGGPGAYYYPLLIQLVFLYPFIYWVIKKWPAKGLAFFGLLNVLWEIIKSAYFVGEECYRLIIFRYLLLIAFGCWMAIGKQQLRRWVLVAGFLIGVGFLYLFSYTGYQAILLTYWNTTSFATALYVMGSMYVVLRSVKLSKLHFMPVEWIGRASYNIYLMQMLYFVLIGWKVAGRIDNVFLQLTIAIFVSVFGGILFYLIESKITSWMIKRVTRIEFKQLGAIENKITNFFMEEQI